MRPGCMPTVWVSTSKFPKKKIWNSLHRRKIIKVYLLRWNTFSKVCWRVRKNGRSSAMHPVSRLRDKVPRWLWALPPSRIKIFFSFRRLFTDGLPWSVSTIRATFLWIHTINVFRHWSNRLWYVKTGSIRLTGYCAFTNSRWTKLWMMPIRISTSR